MAQNTIQEISLFTDAVYGAAASPLSRPRPEVRQRIPLALAALRNCAQTYWDDWGSTEQEV